MRTALSLLYPQSETEQNLVFYQCMNTSQTLVGIVNITALLWTCLLQVSKEHVTFNILGVCFVQESIPNSGSTVTGGEGESVSFYCRVLREINRTQVATEWFIERIGAGVGPQTIVSDSNFDITGKPLPNSGLSSQTNLTIQSLTSDLDRATLSCGLGGTPPTIEASFILRIYRKCVPWACLFEC